jgi:hypothetical protein
VRNGWHEATRFNQTEHAEADIGHVRQRFDDGFRLIRSRLGFRPTIRVTSSKDAVPTFEPCDVTIDDLADCFAFVLTIALAARLRGWDSIGCPDVVQPTAPGRAVPA